MAPGPRRARDRILIIFQILQVLAEFFVCSGGFLKPIVHICMTQKVILLLKLMARTPWPQRRRAENRFSGQKVISEKF